MRLFNVLALITLGLLSWGLYQGLVVAPTEQKMGDVQRIFYYHVPSAWVAFACFTANFVAAIVFLMKRSAKADALAFTTAEVGLVFCTIVLITGPLWARPVWGIWWTWDARLTSTLLLWLVYVSYLLLRRFAVGGSAPALSAALAVFGFLNVIFVYMSIRWFRTQHPQPVIGGGEGSGIAPEMRYALYFNFLAFLAFAALLVWLRYALERRRQMVEEAQAMAALEGVAE